MAVPLEKRCDFTRCRHIGIYDLRLSFELATLRHWKFCIPHRDAIEAVLHDALSRARQEGGEPSAGASALNEAGRKDGE